MAYINLRKYEGRELNAHAKAAVTVLELFRGARLTTGEIAQLTEQTYQGASAMMASLHDGLPITRGGDRRWEWQELERRRQNCL